MPCLGLTSLHTERSSYALHELQLCQCPVSGSRLCTHAKLFRYYSGVLCQCPVSGSRLCTYGIWGKGISYIWIVSMPCLGLTSLHHLTLPKRVVSRTVSMPCLGLTSLHARIERGSSEYLISVNALSRAHVSAPLPLKNLSIYAGFKPWFFVYFSEFSDFWVQ